jgi:peroxiredoxin
MPLALGEPVGDFTFLKADGTPIELRSFLGKPLLVIFLRHLG